MFLVNMVSVDYATYKRARYPVPILNSQCSVGIRFSFLRGYIFNLQDRYWLPFAFEMRIQEGDSTFHELVIFFVSHLLSLSINSSSLNNTFRRSFLQTKFDLSSSQSVRFSRLHNEIDLQQPSLEVSTDPMLFIGLTPFGTSFQLRLVF